MPTRHTGRVLPVRFVGEQHVIEDLGRIPTVGAWLAKIRPKPWMLSLREEIGAQGAVVSFRSVGLAWRTNTVQVTLHFACAVVSSVVAIRAALGVHNDRPQTRH